MTRLEQLVADVREGAPEALHTLWSAPVLVTLLAILLSACGSSTPCTTHVEDGITYLSGSCPRPPGPTCISDSTCTGNGYRTCVDGQLVGIECEVCALAVKPGEEEPLPHCVSVDPKANP